MVQHDFAFSCADDFLHMHIGALTNRRPRQLGRRSARRPCSRADALICADATRYLPLRASFMLIYLRHGWRRVPVALAAPLADSRMPGHALSGAPPPPLPLCCTFALQQKPGCSKLKRAAMCSSSRRVATRCMARGVVRLLTCADGIQYPHIRKCNCQKYNAAVKNASCV